MEEILAFTEGKVKRKEIALSEYKGTTYIQVREKWRKDEDDTEWKFSKKVVSFNKDQFEEVIKTLSQFFDLTEEQTSQIINTANRKLWKP